MIAMKKTLLILLTIIVAGFSLAFITFSKTEPPSDEKINWITVQELDELAQHKNWKKNKKKIFIDLYTDWCGWCKKMDQNTFTNPDIIRVMNEHFYAVKFDAESKDTIMFGNYEYKWVPSGRRGINELGSALGAVDGRIGYPTIVFLNENLEKIQTIPGYKDANGLLPMLVYYGEDHHFTTPWGSFLNQYNEQKRNSQFSD